nr:MAG TPA: hypothetical protein [Caudoviricetes sp.]
MTRTSVRVNIPFVNIIKKKRRRSITGAPTPPVPALLKPKNAFPKMGVLRTACAIPTSIIHIFSKVVKRIS